VDELDMIVAALFSLVATVILLLLLQPLLTRLNMIDVPNERSSHSRPILRGGGLAIALAACAALLNGDVVDSTAGAALFIISAAFAGLGFADDRKSRSVKLRLAAQFVLAATAALLLTQDFDLAPILLVLAAVATAVWVVAYVNIFNFMDGINGITAVTAAIVGATHMVIGTLVDTDLVAIGGAVLLGSAVGFLPFNFPMPRVFAGDVGSYFLGSYIAILSVIALSSGASVVAVAAPLMLYLADTTYTLVRRALTGKRLFESHREHAYQYLANRRLTHFRTTGVVAVLTSICAGLGLLAHERSTIVAVLLLVAIMLLAAVFVRLPSVFVDRRSVPRVAQ
jgi:UDP-GlcNAc:undecaprenyl-phosphate GlcNAc-1-phosphate transferase